MRIASSRRLVLPMGLLLLAGCTSPFAASLDLGIPPLAPGEMDVRPLSADAPKPPQPSSPEEQPRLRLRVPPEIPGSDVPPLTLPPAEASSREARDSAIARLFPALPILETISVAPTGPEGKGHELADLQQMALSNHPIVRQAQADVEAARGAAIQAGLAPNPMVGYSSEDIGMEGTAGRQGTMVTQTIRTAGKLRLARAAAEAEVQRTELALRKAQVDVMSDVRRGYFAVLTARESMTIAQAFSRFTEEVYRLQVEQLKGLQVAAYEPLPFRVLTVQARANLLLARNRFTSAWQQLAAALGQPGLAPIDLAGRADMPAPAYEYELSAARVLAEHTDVRSGQAQMAQARTNLVLQRIMPVPDVSLSVTFHKDHTTQPAGTIAGVQVMVPLPTFDRNQGNIRQAEAMLLRATEESRRAQNELAARLADAFERYQNNRTLISLYREQILPDQVQVFRRVLERYNLQPANVSFNDVSTAQQNLANSLNTYLTALGAQWTSVVDIAALLQTDNLFQGNAPAP